MYINDDPFATYKLLKPEFEKKGYFIDVKIENRSRYVSFTSIENQTWSFKATRTVYPFTSHEAWFLAEHKDKAYDFVKSFGVSTPHTIYLKGKEVLGELEIDALIAKYPKLIVKPSNSLSSRGLTLNITSKEALSSAIQYSRTFKQGVIIQEQVEGDEIRFIVIKGKVEAALLRQTARVIGDGVSTVAELIESENKVRTTLVFPYIRYPQLSEKNIDAKYLTSGKILQAGDVQELNKATMIKNGSSVYDVLTQVHPSYIATVEKLSGVMDTQFLATDLFLKDYTEKQTDDNYWFIEFNTSPALRLCYGCRDGKMFDVMPRLVEVIDEWLHAPRAQA